MSPPGSHRSPAVTAALPGAEDRLGQVEMAERVSRRDRADRHLVVQAGTGTGKTLAYLVPAIESGHGGGRHRHQGAAGPAGDEGPPVPRRAPRRDFDWAVLKGRSNYVCLQRLREMASPDQAQLELDTMAVTTQVEIKRIAEWAATADTGDQAEMEWTPSDNAWRAVSVGSDECPGADRCPLGDPCFAEQARGGPPPPT